MAINNTVSTGRKFSKLAFPATGAPQLWQVSLQQTVRLVLRMLAKVSVAVGLPFTLGSTKPRLRWLQQSLETCDPSTIQAIG